MLPPAGAPAAGTGAAPKAPVAGCAAGAPKEGAGAPKAGACAPKEGAGAPKAGAISWVLGAPKGFGFVGAGAGEPKLKLGGLCADAPKLKPDPAAGTGVGATLLGAGAPKLNTPEGAGAVTVAAAPKENAPVLAGVLLAGAAAAPKLKGAAAGATVEAGAGVEAAPKVKGDGLAGVAAGGAPAAPSKLNTFPAEAALVTPVLVAAAPKVLVAAPKEGAGAAAAPNEAVAAGAALAEPAPNANGFGGSDLPNANAGGCVVAVVVTAGAAPKVNGEALAVVAEGATPAPNVKVEELAPPPVLAPKDGLVDTVAEPKAGAAVTVEDT